MSLVEYTLFGVRDKVADAVERLRLFQPPAGYWLACSYGKDSIVLLDLAKRAKVKFDAHYNPTTVDPPELIHFGRRHCPEVLVQQPPTNMWNLIVAKRMPPTRIVRYCCEVFKEQGGEHRAVLTGVRWQESAKRSKRRMVEQCFRSKTKTYVNPIIDWSTDDVWQYIHDNHLPYCSLYDEGFKRLGCIGCPMAGKHGMLREFARWPKYQAAYLRAFTKCLENRPRDDLLTEWTSPEAMMKWWINGSSQTDIDPDQTVMFE